jgi:hypothetical protein
MENLKSTTSAFHAHVPSALTTMLKNGDQTVAERLFDFELHEDRQCSTLVLVHRMIRVRGVMARHTWVSKSEANDQEPTVNVTLETLFALLAEARLVGEISSYMLIRDEAAACLASLQVQNPVIWTLPTVVSALDSIVVSITCGQTCDVLSQNGSLHALLVAHAARINVSIPRNPNSFSGAFL